MQAGFTLSLLPHPFVCFIQGSCVSVTPWYYFRRKVHWRNVSFPSPTYTPDVLDCPTLFHIRRAHGNLPASRATPICFTHFWKNKHHPHREQEFTIIRIVFSSSSKCSLHVWCSMDSSWNLEYNYPFQQTQDFTRFSTQIQFVETFFPPPGAGWLWPLAKPVSFPALKSDPETHCRGSLCQVSLGESGRTYA